MIPCVGCNGQNSANCKTCNGAGHHELTSCPWAMVTPDVSELVRLVDLMQSGIPPVAGGVYDQTPSFISGMTQFENDDAMWKLDQMKREKPNG